MSAVSVSLSLLCNQVEHGVEHGRMMRGMTDLSELHRPSLHQSGGPPAMPPRAAPSRFDALESAADAGMATPPLAVLLAVALHGQRCPRSQEPLRPHSARPERLPRVPREKNPRHVDAEERLWRCSLLLAQTHSSRHCLCT